MLDYLNAGWDRFHTAEACPWSPTVLLGGALLGYCSQKKVKMKQLSSSSQNKTGWPLTMCPDIWKFQRAEAVRAKEGREELLHVQGTEGQL